MSSVKFAVSRAAERWVAGLVRVCGTVFGDGHVRCLRFAVAGDATTDWLLEHTLEGTRFDLGPLLLSATFAEAAPDLAAGVNSDRMACFEHISALALGGEIAAVLAAGGADITRRLPARDALVVAADFADGLIGDRSDRVLVLRSWAAWSGWFACDVWDRTWVIADPARNEIWLLCVTDGTPRGLAGRTTAPPP